MCVCDVCGVKWLVVAAAATKEEEEKEKAFSLEQSSRVEWSSRAEWSGVETTHAAAPGSQAAVR